MSSFVILIHLNILIHFISMLEWIAIFQSVLYLYVAWKDKSHYFIFFSWYNTLNSTWWWADVFKKYLWVHNLQLGVYLNTSLVWCYQSGMGWDLKYRTTPGKWFGKCQDNFEKVNHDKSYTFLSSLVSVVPLSNVI